MSTIQEIARLLDGSEYLHLPKETVRLARDSAIVICYGASDDLVEFDGALLDEEGGPGDVSLTEHGLYHRKCDDDRCPHELALQKSLPRIRAIWNDKDGPCWTFKTDIPHEKFRLMEDGEVFCEGIVFLLADVAKVQPK
jgi:hypothetical protein